MARRDPTAIEVTRERVEGNERARKAPAQRARQIPNRQVHSTGTEKLATGRKSSRLAEVNQVSKPARRHWQRPSSLPVVPEIPGHRVRYTRIDEKNRGDKRNVEKRLREGWELVRKDELPKHSLPALTLGRYGEVIGTDDMVLMKMHEDLVEERNREYSGRTKRQTKGVLDTLREMGQTTGLKRKDLKIQVNDQVDIPRPRRGAVRDDDDE
jgi:hypothetical protein